jgi:predicted TIM-barrel fold metal-dependent hydrolase
MIIDTHTHIFPDNAAESILTFTARKFNVKVYGKGTVADLIAQMDANKVSYAVIHMVAINPKAAQAINTWLINLSEPRFIKFGTIHPHQQDYKQEILRLKENGIRGIKLQPAVQGFTVDNAELTYPLYEELSKNGMTVMFHVGGNPTPYANQHSTPKMVLRVAEDFPELTIIAAHLGGLNMWDEVAETLAGRENVYMETSMTYENILPTVAEKIIRKHGPRKIFFGTDYPFAPIKKCIERARELSFLTQQEKADLMGENARRFFQL